MVANWESEGELYRPPRSRCRDYETGELAVVMMMMMVVMCICCHSPGALLGVQLGYGVGIMEEGEGRENQWRL
ncbi:hypothetical protein EYF80_020932 [Liparis tanakae]|uniref:Uncharacterized protein n=1 Tax=Liparis tanakae TaxID=230148 RepID=A0A4Z2HT56_9TELE|nr:hypothetical protein EYF80_020932 [Liparis tanakae]